MHTSFYISMHILTSNSTINCYRAKKKLLSALLFLSSYHAGISQANTIDPLTNILTLDSVIFNGFEYPNVVVRIDQFSVLGVGNSVPEENKISETCTENDLTKDKYDKIEIGMSIDHVTQIIGCQAIRSYIPKPDYFDTDTSNLRVFNFELPFLTNINIDSSNPPPKPDIWVGTELSEGNYFIRLSPINSTRPYKHDNNLSNSHSLPSAASKFDPATNVLTMDSVSVTGHRKYENVVISVSQFTMLGVGGTSIRPAPPIVSPPPPPPPVLPAPQPPVNIGSCGLDRFTTANYNAIQPGMTVEEVTQIMGCQFDPRMTRRVGGLVTHAWTNFEVTQMFIAVMFDESTMRVSDSFDKYWQGRSFVNQ
jgi:hypothetical protein